MKIYKNLVEGVTRMNEKYDESIIAWAKAEENLGLTKSIFILQKNGNLTQYYDYDEGASNMNTSPDVIETTERDKALQGRDFEERLGAGRAQAA